MRKTIARLTVVWCILVASAFVFGGPISPQGGTITSVCGSNGVTGCGTAGVVNISADTTYVQKRVTGTCSPPNAVGTVNADGSVSCNTTGTGTVSSVGCSSGLLCSPSPITTTGTISLSLPGASCSAGSFVTAISAGGTGTCTNPNSEAVQLGQVSLQEISAAPSTTQNDWAPTGIATAGGIKLTNSTSSLLCAITGGVDGRVLILHFTGAGNVTIANNGDGSCSSTSTNVISTSIGQDITFSQSMNAVIQYDGTLNHWRLIASSIPFGSGLTWSGGLFTYNNATIQSRLSGSCTSPNAIVSVGATGTVTCSTNVAQYLGTVTSTFDAIFTSTPGQIISGSMSDDGTSITIQGEKPTFCTISSSTTLVNLTIPNNCTFAYWRPTTNAQLVGIAPPSASTSRHFTMYMDNSMGGNVTYYLLNSNATTTAWQLEGDFSAWLTVDTKYTWDYDITNSKWVPDFGADMGSLNINGTLITTSNLQTEGDIELIGSLDQYIINLDAANSGTQNLNIDAAGTGVIRFNSNTGSLPNSGTGGVLFDSGGASPTQQAFIGSTGAQITPPLYYGTSTSASGVSTGTSAPTGACTTGSTYINTTSTASPSNYTCQNGLWLPQWDNSDYNGTHFVWTDDWVTGVSVTAGTNPAATSTALGNSWAYFISPTAGTATIAGLGSTTVGSRPGIVSITANNTSSQAYVGIEWGTSQTFVSGATWGFRWVGGFGAQCANSAAGCHALVGFASGVNGCYFLYDPGNTLTITGTSGVQNWWAVCDNAGSITAYQLNGTGSCDTGSKGSAPVAATTWPSTNVNDLYIVATNATQIDFYSYSGTTQTHLCTITTHIPTTVWAPVFTLSTQISGGSSNHLDTDFTKVTEDLTSARTP